MAKSMTFGHGLVSSTRDVSNLLSHKSSNAGWSCQRAAAAFIIKTSSSKQVSNRSKTKQAAALLQQQQSGDFSLTAFSAACRAENEWRSSCRRPRASPHASIVEADGVLPHHGARHPDVQQRAGSENKHAPDSNSDRARGRRFFTFLTEPRGYSEADLDDTALFPPPPGRRGTRDTFQRHVCGCETIRESPRS